MAQKDVIVLTGIKETIDALNDFDKDAVKRFNAVVASELNRAKTKAQGFIPASTMRGWTGKDVVNPGKTVRGGEGFPPYDKAKIIAGIKISRKQGRARRWGDYTTSAGSLIQEDAAGAIFEIAGRRGTDNQFTQNLDRFRKASRGIWRAVDEEREGIARRVEAALNDAKTTLQRHFNERRG